MASNAVDYSTLDAFEPIELLQLPETHSSRPRQSSLEPDIDVQLLPKSTPVAHSETTTTEADEGLVKAVKSLRHRLRGWRFGVLLASATSSFVLLINCVAIITIHLKYGTQQGVSTAFEGDCNVANQWSLGLHIVINALSSVLLGASNYTMQVLNAPTRSECDKAHARDDWLDIGITSLRNIVRITGPRRVLWLLLGLSSVPLHLFYNSAAFKTIDANVYVVVIAPPLVLQSGAWPPPNYKKSESYWGGNTEYAKSESESLRQAYNSQNLDFANLTAAECINTYGVDFVTGHSDVIAMISGPYLANVSFAAVTDSRPKIDSKSLDPYAWMCAIPQCPLGDKRGKDEICESGCDMGKLKATPDQWKVYDLPIDYCLARKTEPHCKLQFSRDILIVVIVCNLCKAAAMMATLLLQHEPTLVTTGDAISSWLQYPDKTTANRSLQSFNRSSARRALSRSLSAHDASIVTDWSPVAVHRSSVVRWHQAVDRRRWNTTMTLWITILAVAGILSGAGVGNPAQAAGFGAITSRTIIQTSLPSTGTSGVLTNVLVANIPQLISSCLYLFYNGLFTNMCLAHEYSNYSICRKALRVTSPRGEQRSTHWLHLPYIYSVPLLAASALLHWSISQSIFFVGIDIYRGADFEQSQYGLGFSVQPIILDIVLCICMLFVLVGMGFRKLHGKIPLASSNSFGISAACHRPEEDTDAAFKPVMWGEAHTESNRELRHRSFTSMDVTAELEERMYAGVRRRERKECTALPHPGLRVCK